MFAIILQLLVSNFDSFLNLICVCVCVCVCVGGGGGGGDGEGGIILPTSVGFP